MAGLLAWAADVVGGGGNHSNEDERDSIPIIFTPEQKRYVQELDRKAASLTRMIRDLRMRLPPPDISQRLPHLHAHSLASNAALALQLNSHSATREQAQWRELTLNEENAAYEKAISDCENKILEKQQEADLLLGKLEEIDEMEQSLRVELANAEAVLENTQSVGSGQLASEYTARDEVGQDVEAPKSISLVKLEDKKKELSSLEETIKDLERKWTEFQDNALKQPSPAQREKMLDKQLHSLIEQLAVKQAQAEGLVSDFHLKEMELERLNGLLKSLESSSSEVNIARNRFGRSTSNKGSSDFIIDSHHKLPYYNGGRSESQQRLMLLRSTFVLYILALHILVFIRISF